MSTETPTSTEGEAKKTSGEDKENEISKQTFRKQVWEHLEKNNLASFPRPVYGRIPNFKGCEEAAAKLHELEEYKAVNYVEVNPDKPQEAARILILEDKKSLYVPVPRLKEGLLKYITVPDHANRADIKKAVNRRGLEYNGKTINVKDKVQIDLLVLGSVAVSKDGYRIGKGRGYADLEFAMLLEMGAVNNQTVVATTVHDSQVFDTLPKEIFKEYDVPIDYILTPTQVIKVEHRLPKPKGIYWHILSQRRLNLMPVLQALKEIHDSEGRDTTLKDVDTDIESYDQQTKFRRFRRFKRRRPRSIGKTSESQGEETNNENIPPRRPQRSRRFFRKPKIAKKDEKAPENGEMVAEKQQRKVAKRFRRPFRKNRPQIDFSLMVSNIEKNVRVRDLKNALNERGIKPNDITWRGYKGFCYLHYAKSNPKKIKEEQPPIIVDNVIEILQNLKISPDSDTNLSVKVLEPISRIETTDVTAV